MSDSNSPVIKLPIVDMSKSLSTITLSIIYIIYNFAVIFNSDLNNVGLQQSSYKTSHCGHVQDKIGQSRPRQDCGRRTGEHRLPVHRQRGGVGLWPAVPSVPVVLLTPSGEEAEVMSEELGPGESEHLQGVFPRCGGRAEPEGGVWVRARCESWWCPGTWNF